MSGRLKPSYYASIILSIRPKIIIDSTQNSAKLMWVGGDISFFIIFIFHYLHFSLSSFIYMHVIKIHNKIFNLWVARSKGLDEGQVLDVLTKTFSCSVPRIMIGSAPVHDINNLCPPTMLYSSISGLCDGNKSIMKLWCRCKQHWRKKVLKVREAILLQ